MPPPSWGVQEPLQARRESVIAKLALPNREHSPSRPSQAGNVEPVAPYVPLEFGVPVRQMRSGTILPGAASVSVPEASVDEHDFAPSGENQIGTSGQIAG